MKKIIIKILEKFRKRYPLWLEAFLVKKHWIYPEPKIKQLYKTINGEIIASTTMRTEEMMIDVVKMLLDKAWQNMWIEMRHGFFPDISTIEIISYDRPMDWSKIIGIKWVTNYKHHAHLMYMQELMEEMHPIHVISRLTSQKQPFKTQTIENK